MNVSRRGKRRHPTGDPSVGEDTDEENWACPECDSFFWHGSCSQDSCAENTWVEAQAYESL